MTDFRAVIETDRNKTFASTFDWPGWSRSGKTEATAIETLLTYMPTGSVPLSGWPVRCVIRRMAWHMLDHARKMPD